MKFLRLNTLTAIALAWFSLTCLTVYGQDKHVLISFPEHQKRLNEYKSRADGYCAKNLNRFGLDELQKYDKSLDSLVAKEIADSVASIQKIYLEKVAKRKSETGDLKTQLEELNKNKELYSDRYNKLLRKAGLAFIIWLVLVVLLLAWRKRLVKNSQLELDDNQEQLKVSETYFDAGEELFKQAVENQKKIPEMNQLVSDMQNSVVLLSEQLSPELFKSDGFKALQKNAETIRTTSNRLASLAAVVASQHNDPVKEKQPANINLLCEQYSDLVYSGMLNEDGSVQTILTKDFEKNLPAIKIIPDEIGSLLMYILGNAFQSTSEKVKKGIKGYVPKVSISTRILPRFVQIRVKDNSDGIPDEELEQIYEPFYSNRLPGEGAGLGLYFSERIIKENNGEIKIESETGNGTDVYIKFFLQS